LFLPPNNTGGSRNAVFDSPPSPFVVKPELGRRHPGLDELAGMVETLLEVAERRLGLINPVERTWELVLTTASIEVWIISWPPGGSIDLHDQAIPWAR
jgi:hypothetical protein